MSDEVPLRKWPKRPSHHSQRGKGVTVAPRPLTADITAEDLAFNKRMKQVHCPPEMKSTEAAEQWTEERKALLTPQALAEQEWQLRYGTNSERAAASRFLLSIAGHAPNDSKVKGGGNTGPVVVLVGAGIGSMSWGAVGPALVDVAPTPLPKIATLPGAIPNPALKKK